VGGRSVAVIFRAVLNMNTAAGKAGLRQAVNGTHRNSMVVKCSNDGLHEKSPVAHGV